MSRGPRSSSKSDRKDASGRPSSAAASPGFGPGGPARPGSPAPEAAELVDRWNFRLLV